MSPYVNCTCDEWVCSGICSSWSAPYIPQQLHVPASRRAARWHPQRCWRCSGGVCGQLARPRWQGGCRRVLVWLPAAGAGSGTADYSAKTASGPGGSSVDGRREARVCSQTAKQACMRKYHTQLHTQALLWSAANLARCYHKNTVTGSWRNTCWDMWQHLYFPHCDSCGSIRQKKTLTPAVSLI